MDKLGMMERSSGLPVAVKRLMAGHCLKQSVASRGSAIEEAPRGCGLTMIGPAGAHPLGEKVLSDDHHPVALALRSRSAERYMIFIVVKSDYTGNWAQVGSHRRLLTNHSPVQRNICSLLPNVLSQVLEGGLQCVLLQHC